MSSPCAGPPGRSGDAARRRAAATLSALGCPVRRQRPRRGPERRHPAGHRRRGRQAIAAVSSKSHTRARPHWGGHLDDAALRDAAAQTAVIIAKAMGFTAPPRVQKIAAHAAAIFRHLIRQPWSGFDAIHFLRLSDPRQSDLGIDESRQMLALTRDCYRCRVAGL